MKKIITLIFIISIAILTGCTDVNDDTIVNDKDILEEDIDDLITNEWEMDEFFVDNVSLDEDLDTIQTETSNDSYWRFYENHMLGFALQYPSSWDIGEKVFDSAHFKETIFYSARTGSQILTIFDDSFNRMKNIRKENKVMGLTEEQSNIGGQEIYEYNRNDCEYSCDKLIYLPYKEKIYIFQLFDLKYNDELYQIIESFKAL